jgi:hypothetical protein
LFLQEQLKDIIIIIIIAMLNHGATAEKMTTMGYKLFTDKATFMPKNNMR